MQKNFVVYKSSAGSGKTFTLVKEYLKIALSEVSDQPQLYKKILAVTFTNKAAAEMKERIITALKSIAEGDIKKQELIGTLLCTELQLAPETLKYRAQNLLSQILHNYSDFSIGTIDSFTHKIIKTFAFDLKLPVNFSIETNVDEFYNKVVAGLMSRIGDNPELTELLLQFSVNNAGDNNSWDPEPQLFDFTSTLEKENSGAYLQKLKQLDKEQLLQIQKDLSKFIADFKNTLKSAGNKLQLLISGKGLCDEHFNYKASGPQNVFKKWADFKFDKVNDLIGSRLPEALDSDKWLGKTTDSDVAAAFENIAPQVKQIASETIEFIKANSKRFALYRLLEKNIYSIILVNELQQIADEFKAEEQIVFISEFNSKISKVVSEEPAPFIYERLGERFSHFLLDEFQDTSTLQWQNILPLIDNSLANGKFNLIVGDGKQSIYRWRNANVKQFNNLPLIEGATGNELLGERQLSLELNYKEDALNTNYRSLAEVVDFNNSLFDTLAQELLKNELGRIYHNQAQKKKNESGGYVSIEHGESKRDELEETTCKKVLSHIEKAISDGFSYNDICIISRNNRQGNLTANYLIEKGLPVVSSDSLLLKNNAEVNCVIAFLKYLVNPSDLISASAVLTYIYLKLNLQDQLPQQLRSLSMGSGIYKALSPAGITLSDDDFEQKNVFDICVEIISKLQLHHHNAQYMRFFLDEVNDYLVNKTGSVNNFLEWWEKRGEMASVIIPEGTNAVRIMSIHKSKGLEFPVVILPFTNWDTYKTQNSWVNLEDEDTDLPAGLLNISSGIADAGFEDVFEEEKNQQVLDNTNLLYVAFTRAVERLHIITLRSETNKRETVARWMDLYLKIKNIRGANNVYEFGTLQNKLHNTPKPQSKLFDISGLDFNTNPHLISIKGAHKLKLEDEVENAREKGIQMHYILSEINSENDISHVLEKMLKLGLISKEQAPELRSKITELIHHKALGGYFSGTMKSKNESEIINEMGEILRPDKIVFYNNTAVVIDYKTGKQNTRVYQKQMDKYALALQKMGYSQVKKVLVYVEENVVEELE